MKYIALVDCDSYFCSCERIFAPDLNKKPTIVLSNNDGACIALTPEAKALGIKMCDPYYQIKSLIKKHNIAVFSSNYELYGDISKRIFMVLKEFTPKIENYSIDESFLEMNDINKPIDQTCQDIVYRCKQWVGIPVKVGCAKTLTLTKVAAELVKKQKIISKYKILLDPEEIKEVLYNFPINDIWGIGRQLTKKLNSRGVKTAANFLRLDDDYIRKYFSINLLRTKWELQGRPSLDMELVPQTRKNHCHSRTFGQTVSKKKDLKESIVSYTSTAAANIRGMKLKAQSISVHIRTNFFNKNLPQYSNSITIALPYQANDTMTLVKYALEGFERIFKEGYLYKKSSILLNELVDEVTDQPNFFEKSDPGNDRLSKVMDKINNQFGKGSIQLASTGIRKQKWQLQRNLISKRYTTRFDELFKI
ncbi:MAG TPA: Y-family DNA polymerase [Victivallales bacterium]|nr:Y-family DNA polymerase [Victivallales bacterium]